MDTHTLSSSMFQLFRYQYSITPDGMLLFMYLVPPNAAKVVPTVVYQVWGYGPWRKSRVERPSAQRILFYIWYSSSSATVFNPFNSPLLAV